MKGKENKSKKNIGIILAITGAVIVLAALYFTVFENEALKLIHGNNADELTSVNVNKNTTQISNGAGQTNGDFGDGSQNDVPAQDNKTDIKVKPITQIGDTEPDPSERIELRIGDKTEDIEIGYVSEFDDMKSYYDINDLYYSKDKPEGKYLSKTDLIWTSDNEDIAVALYGALTPKSEGTATITAEYNGLKDSIKVIVKKDAFVEIGLEYNELVLDKELLINKSHSRIYTFVKTLYGEKFEITNREETHWTAQNGYVEIIGGGIRVNQKGYVEIIGRGVRAKDVGKDIVTVEFFGLTTTLNVEVKDRKIKEIRLSDEEIIMSYDGSGAIEGYFTGLLAELDDGTILTISNLATWSSDDYSVADVNEAGYVSIGAVGVGETLIHADYEDYHGTIKVKVEEKKVKNIFRDPKENELYFNVGKNAMCVFLTAEYEDGSTVGITGDADWRSEDPSVAAVRDGGIEVVGAGETIIHIDIDYLNYHETIKVIVLENRN